MHVIQSAWLASRDEHVDILTMSAGDRISLRACQCWAVFVSEVFGICYNKIMYFNLCKLRRLNVCFRVIGHLYFFVKLLFCVTPVRLSFPIVMMFFLLIFEISLYMWIHSFYSFPSGCHFTFSFVDEFFLHGDVKFKLCNKMHPSLTFKI